MYNLNINALSPVLGAEISGLDIFAPIPDATFDHIHKLFLDHLVLVFRDQHLSPQDQIEFSRRFGSLKSHVLTQYLHMDHPELLVISNKKIDGISIGIEDAGRYWHSDVSYDREPPMASMLYALEVPPSGGDTLFANSYTAYDMLPDDLKRRIDPLRALHRFNYSQIQQQKGNTRVPLSAEQERQLTGAYHPIVRTHPETGRKALYVNPGFTDRVEGMNDQKSLALLEELFSYATDTSVVYRHSWQQFDLVLWDNRCTMHHATEYDHHHTRHMLRTTIEGDVPC